MRDDQPHPGHYLYRKKIHLVNRKYYHPGPTGIFLMAETCAPVTHIHTYITNNSKKSQIFFAPMLTETANLTTYHNYIYMPLWLL